MLLKDQEMEYTTPSRKSTPIDVSGAQGYNNLKYFAANNMVTPLYRESQMLAKIRRIPAECQTEVSAFIDYLLEREEKKRHNKAFVAGISKLSEKAFSRI